LDAGLLPIAKPAGGIRRIAIGKVRYRLAALCALAACPEARSSSFPLQVGVSVRGGSHILGHTLRAGIAADPGCVALQIDWRNAFNTLRRNRMLAADAAPCPALLPLLILAYKQPSRLPVHHASGVIIHSQIGVWQGDPLGPLFIALALQGPLEQAAEMDLERTLDDGDDNFLQGSPEPTIRAYHSLVALAVLVALAATLRLHV
jgi:hypothetical protein